jgi:hypothetical protein
VDEPPPLRDRVAVRSRRLGVTLGSLVPMLAVLAPGIVAASKGSLTLGSEGVSYLMVLFFATLLPLIVAALGIGVRRDWKEIEATASALTIGGKTALTREQMAEGYVRVDALGRPRVRIVGQKGGATLDLECSTRERAVELLRALRLDVAHRLFETHGICNLDSLNIPARMVVGSDGLLVTIAGFVPYSDMTSIERDGAVVVVKRTHGTDVRLLAAGHSAALEERLREGLDAFRRGEASGDVAALVSRQGRPVQEWARYLASLLSVRDYRTSNVTPDVLWRIAEDPKAPAASRAGAAAALRTSLDDHGRERLRAAAEASASPHVRVALEAAATPDGDEVALERALERCADEA